MRATVLPGAVVRGSDGQLVGRVRDIYLHDRSGEFAAITVKPGQLSSRTVLIPAAAIARLGDEVAEARGTGAEARGAGPEAREAGAGTSGAGAGAGASGTGPEAHGAEADAPTAGNDGPGGSADSDEAPRTQDATVHLAVDSMAVRAGISAPDTDHATPTQLRLAARELGIEEAATG